MERIKRDEGVDGGICKETIPWTAGKRKDSDMKQSLEAQLLTLVIEMHTKEVVSQLRATKTAWRLTGKEMWKAKERASAFKLGKRNLKQGRTLKRKLMSWRRGKSSVDWNKMHKPKMAKYLSHINSM